MDHHINICAIQAEFSHIFKLSTLSFAFRTRNSLQLDKDDLRGCRSGLIKGQAEVVFVLHENQTTFYERF